MSEPSTPARRTLRELLGGRPRQVVRPYDAESAMATAAAEASAFVSRSAGISFAEVKAPERFTNPSLLASATRITKKTVNSPSFRKSTNEIWQNDAWAMFDLVGELRYICTTLAQRTSKARLYVGRLDPTDPTAQPTPVNDPNMTAMLNSIGNGPLGMSQLIQRLTQNLFIAGDGWLAGIPREMIKNHADANKDQEMNDDEQLAPPPQFINRGGTSATNGTAGSINDGSQTLDDLEWRMLSVSEVQFMQGSMVKLKLGPANMESITCSPDDIYLIRVWRSHPRFWWQSDSPVRSSLPVLRELVGLTMHVSAQVDSRLAGAGILVVPETAARAVKRAANIPDDSQEDPLTDALLEAMLTPIQDRSNASAIVPLVLTVPDESAAMFKHITFDKPFDAQAVQLRNEAITRLGLGLDAPPELLHGNSDSNHWNAWLTDEDVISTHIEPPLGLIADALTTQFFRPLLLENGMPESEAEQYVIWYDTTDLHVQPNQAADAVALHAAGALSAKTLRKANGFDDSDAPDEETDDPAVSAVFRMVEADPGLMLRPGLDVLLKQMRALLSGNPLSAIDDVPESVASKAVAGPNVEDRDDPTIEPVSPPETPAAGASAAPKPPSVAPAATTAPAPRAVGTPRQAVAHQPLQRNPGAPPMAAAATDVQEFALRTAPLSDGIYEGPPLVGSLSARLAAYEAEDKAAREQELAGAGAGA